jgi:hypothetical protein
VDEPKHGNPQEPGSSYERKTHFEFGHQPRHEDIMNPALKRRGIKEEARKLGVDELNVRVGAAQAAKTHKSWRETPR